MSRFVTAKRAALVAVAAGASTLALVAGASASSATTHAQLRATPPALTLDFSGTNDESGAASAVGAGFGGSAKVKDADGNIAGTAYDMCDKDAISVNAVTAFCHADVVFKDGSQLALSVVFPIQNPATATYPKSFDGVVEGGTGDYAGFTGTAHFTNTSLGVYKVSFAAS